MGKFAEANIRLESHHQFPEFQTDVAIHTGPFLEEDNASSQSERSLSPSRAENPLPGSLNSENEYLGMSFAKVIIITQLVFPFVTYSFLDGILQINTTQKNIHNSDILSKSYCLK